MQTNQKEAQIITGRLKAPNGNPAYITKSSLQQTNHSFLFSDGLSKVTPAFNHSKSRLCYCSKRPAYCPASKSASA
ncbi:hypothetical protein NEISICOT_02151 [Neisseria sicca ATCC 29256]|uniref:Uncharacterized protein n=1 Tax=Neisseria sicca ATCC 29256 TaxID=547045 RepID=C6M6J9_NEISI|nr:hypothetical protein NEISICOT_02151 [Neisseria sicca ATCC 29256]